MTAIAEDAPGALPGTPPPGSPPVPDAGTSPLAMLGRAARRGDMRLLLDLLGPALRGFVLRRGRQDEARIPVRHEATLRRDLGEDQAEMRTLYEVAKRSQWNSSTDLDWDQEVDPEDPRVELIREDLLPLASIPAYQGLPAVTKRQHRHQLLAWMLSQFLHGEQGALFAACQVTQAVQWSDGKLFGSSQVVDEGRHVEVFYRYLREKLERVYSIDDNLYTIVDALMVDSRWDMKFLGMQIMIEGLALGAFGVLRGATQEPLLRELLRRVIVDEARHVHFGVVALRDHIGQLSERDRREREDWAFEVAVMMRNRFLAHEFYEEFYGHCMTRAEWDRHVLASPYMERFRRMMFRRLVPNLRAIGLLTDRVRPYYRSIGVLQWEDGKAADEVGVDELLAA